MKWFLIILAFLNLLFFGYTEIRQDRATESLLAHQNLHSDKIRLLALAEKPVNTGAANAFVRSCSEWGPVAGADLAEVRKALASYLANGQVRENAPGKARYWVYISPLASEAQALERLETLRAAGIADSLVIRDSPNLRNGISLGVFNDEAAAKAQLEILKQKGITDAKIIARAKAETPASFVFVVEDAALKQQLEQLKQAYPKIAAQDVACPKSNSP